MTNSNFCHLSIVLSLFLANQTSAQVILRDTTVNWQHHRSELRGDYSTASDTDIDEVSFSGKVLENDLIRHVVLPEYGAKITLPRQGIYILVVEGRDFVEKRKVALW